MLNSAVSMCSFELKLRTVIPSSNTASVQSSMVVKLGFGSASHHKPLIKYSACNKKEVPPPLICHLSFRKQVLQYSLQLEPLPVLSEASFSIPAGGASLKSTPESWQSWQKPSPTNPPVCRDETNLLAAAMTSDCQSAFVFR